jgi:hypothetical protein
MPARFAIAAIVLLMSTSFARAAAAAAVDPAVERNLDHRFTKDIRPFIEEFCADCHGKEMPEAQLDLSRFQTMANVVEDHPHWAAVAEKLSAKEGGGIRCAPWSAPPTTPMSSRRRRRGNR